MTSGKRYVQELDWLLPKWGYGEHLYHSIFTDPATGGYSWELQETDRVYGNGDFQSPNKPGYNIKHHWGKNLIKKKGDCSLSSSFFGGGMGGVVMSK